MSTLTRKQLKDAKPRDGYSEKMSNRKWSDSVDGVRPDAEDDMLEREGGVTIQPTDAEYNPYYPAPIDEIFGKKISKSLRASFDLGIEDYTKDQLLHKIGKEIVNMAKLGMQARYERDKIVRECINSVLMIPPADRQSPLGDDGSNISTPTTFEPRQTLHAFFHGVTTGVRPFAKVEPTKEGSDETQAAHKIEDLLDSYLSESDECNWIKYQDEILAYALDEGTVFVNERWCRQIDKVRDVQILSPDNAESFGFELPEDPENWKWGNVLESTKKGVKNSKIGTLFDGERETMTRNEPGLKAVSYFDYVQYPAKEQKNQKAVVSGGRFYMTIDEMRHGVASKMYDSEQVHRVEQDSFRAINDTWRTNINDFYDGAADDTMEQEEYTSEFQQLTERREIDGESVANPYVKLEFIDVCVKLDGNGDERSEEWSFVIETSTCHPIVARRYIGNPGEGYLVPLSIYPLPGRLYGLPLGYILASLQEQADVTANLFLDAAAIACTSIIEELEGNKDAIGENELHVGINSRTVDEFGKIEIHALGKDMPDMKAFNANEFIQSLAEKVTAVNETLSGGTGQRGQTATETMQVVNSAARRLKVGVTRIQEVNKTLIARTLADVRRYALQPKDMKQGLVPESIDYSLTRAGESVYGSLTIEELFMPVRIRMFGDSENTNMQLQLQGAEKLWMMMERDPTFMGGNLVHKYNVEAHVLDAYGVRNISQFIGTAKDADQMQKQADAQKGPKPPPIPEKADEMWMATWLAENDAEPEMDPETKQPTGGGMGSEWAQKVLKYIREVYTASKPEAAAGIENEKALAQAHAQIEKAKVDTHRQIAEEKIKMTAEKERMKTDLNTEKAVSQAQNQIQMDSERAAMERQSQEQLTSGRIANQQASSEQSIANKEALSKERLNSQKKATTSK